MSYKYSGQHRQSVCFKVKLTDYDLLNLIQTTKKKDNSLLDYSIMYNKVVWTCISERNTPQKERQSTTVQVYCICRGKKKICVNKSDRVRAELMKYNVYNRYEYKIFLHMSRYSNHKCKWHSSVNAAETKDQQRTTRVKSNTLLKTTLIIYWRVERCEKKNNKFLITWEER